MTLAQETVNSDASIASPIVNMLEDEAYVQFFLIRIKDMYGVILFLELMVKN